MLKDNVKNILADIKTKAIGDVQADLAQVILDEEALQPTLLENILAAKAILVSSKETVAKAKDVLSHMHNFTKQ